MAANTTRPSSQIVELAALTTSDPRPTLFLEPSSRVLAANPAARRLSSALYPGMMLVELACGADAIRTYLRACTQTAGPVIGALRFGSSTYRCDGGRLEIAGTPLVVLRLRDRQEANATFHRLNARISALNAELAQRRRSEAELSALLAEKQLLLAELNHRVKNNLAVMLSMTKMAARGEAEPRVREKLTDLHSRISAISTVHSLLYGAETGRNVMVAQLLTKLTESIARGFNREEISISVRAGELRCPPDVAVSLALIVNELVTNAYKHAFPQPGRGSIDIALAPLDAGRWQLLVTDDGPFVTSYRRGGGLAIVDAIAAQLKGTLEAAAEPPKRFVVTLAAPM